ncbi:MAG: Wzz/FepE/Etk N-terminal domain-containing protein [Bacteroidota bacterium]|nr:Wzz/FepE/Etk N-terminal domain-containing protein [Bacteroidota bacterium]
MEQYNDEIKLKDILIKLSEYKQELWNKKRKIILFSFLICALGVSINFFSPKLYNAELTFVVEDAKGANPLGAMSGIASQFGFDIGANSSSTFSQQNIMQLLKSRSVVEATLLRTGKIEAKRDLLVEHYITINKIREQWKRNKEFDGVNFNHTHSLKHDSIVGEIWSQIVTNKLTIEIQNDEANIITLSYVSENENFAKQFTETLIDEMREMYIAHQTEQARNTLDFLQDRADSVFVELDKSEQEFARVKDINQRIIKASGRLKELQLMREVEVLNTMYLEIIKNLEISKITLLNQTPIINIIDKPILPLKEESLSKVFAGILGGFLGAFLAVSFFVFSKLFKDALTED